MHQYLIDDEIRTKTFVFTAILSVIAARLLSLLLEIAPFNVPWWVEIPSVLGFFGFFLWLYNTCLWRIWPFRNLGWFYIPDLNGKWKVVLTSSFKGFDEEKQATATIRQTASRMGVSFQTKESFSYSTSAALQRTERINTYELTYHYVNQPKADALYTMNSHHGSTWLTIQEDGQCMEGEYFSGRGRQNFGKITFNRLK